MHPLLKPIAQLPKMGPKRMETLHQASIESVYDLLCVLPKSYEERIFCQKIADLNPDFICSLTAKVMRLNKGQKKAELLVQDESGFLKILFFHSLKTLHKRFEPGQVLTLVGKPEKTLTYYQMIHPQILLEDQAKEQAGIFPVYPEIPTFYPKDYRNLVQFALQVATLSQWPDILSEEALKRHQLCSLKEAFSVIHDPQGRISLWDLNHKNHPAFDRMAFNELVTFYLALKQKNAPQKEEVACPILCPDSLLETFKQGLPFELTGAQKRVLDEIRADFQKSTPMNRLLQGDVGCGKTAVAATATYMATKSGYQCAIMAPTEILARQHAANFEKWLQPHGVSVGLLLGKQPQKERKQILQKIETGAIQVVVGTHALISEGVSWQRLGFCVVDEQHRFGVLQRQLLKEKGFSQGQMPHMLAMTATPIPRSLALTLYGDLDLSIIDELPKGRKPILTHLLRGNPFEQLKRLMERVKEQNKKAYVVYPLVEESEKVDLEDATQGFLHISQWIGAEKVGLLHGRLKANEKEQVMEGFLKGKLQVLVCTTVVEVGVHVDDATIMAIMHPERFGLSQLHQLRGRVGRGGEESHCFLISKPFAKDSPIQKRLEIMTQSNDGFYIANEDLGIRGPGDFLGTRQSGEPWFRYLDFQKHARLLEPTRDLVKYILKKDPNLTHISLQIYQKKYLES